jgi:hypothetical protein
MFGEVLNVEAILCRVYSNLHSYRAPTAIRDQQYRFKKSPVREVQDSGSVIFVCRATRLALVTTFLINNFHY